VDNSLKGRLMHQWFVPFALFAVLMPGTPATVQAADETLAPEAAQSSGWQQEFHLDQRHFLTSGANDYFFLVPHFRLILEGPGAKLMITVLDDTVQVGKIMTRVVEEREWEEGQLVEVSRNFYAMDARTKDIFYFGEEVTSFPEGKSEKGNDSWRADDKGAHAGLMMPGTPEVGMKYYQEFAPGRAMDRADIATLSLSFKTPVGTFANCLRTRESSGLNPDELEFKTYAPGIGLVQDEELLLSNYGFSRGTKTIPIRGR